MISDFLPILLGELKLALFDKLQQVLRGMHYFEIHTEFGILILERVITMWRRNKDLLHPVVDEGLNIFPGQVPEKCLVTDLTNTLSAAIQLGSQYPEIYPRLAKDIGSGNSHLLRSCVIAGVATWKIKNLCPLGERFDSQILRPIAPLFS
jgi:hypothetical protein